MQKAVPATDQERDLLARVRYLNLYLYFPLAKILRHQMHANASGMPPPLFEQFGLTFIAYIEIISHIYGNI